jgi:hypothetical protein
MHVVLSNGVPIQNFFPEEETIQKQIETKQRKKLSDAKKYFTASSIFF